MKSAFELALERTGGKLKEISEEKKQKLAEIDKIYQSKIAEAQLSTDQRLAKETDPVKAEEIRNALVTEFASIRDRWERRKKQDPRRNKRQDVPLCPSTLTMRRHVRVTPIPLIFTVPSWFAFLRIRSPWGFTVRNVPVH